MDVAVRVKVFEAIPLALPRDRVLKRLGYNRHRTQVHQHHEALIDEAIQLGFSLCRTRGCYARIAIADRDEAGVTLATGDRFASASLARLLSHSTEVLLLAATVGADLIDAIDAAVEEESAFRAAVFDAVGSETVDAALGWIHDYVRRLAPRERLGVTRHRYSPGYGDLGLENQQQVFGLLDLTRFDLQISPRYMLIPEKSVIGIAGLEPVDSAPQPTG